MKSLKLLILIATLYLGLIIIYSSMDTKPGWFAIVYLLGSIAAGSLMTVQAMKQNYDVVIIEHRREVETIKAEDSE